MIQSFRKSLSLSKNYLSCIAYRIFGNILSVQRKYAMNSIAIIGTAEQRAVVLFGEN